MLSDHKHRAIVLLVAGIALMTVSWAIAWSRTPVASEHSFFPLWVGYIATANGLGEFCFRDSLVKRLGRSFLWLFIFSIPFWWFFELLNLFVENWRYASAAGLTRLRFAIEASISFSTVLPAVMSTIRLCKSAFDHYGCEFKGRPFAIRKLDLALSVLLGSVGLCIIGLFPTIAFPLVWIAPLLIVEPVSYLLGYDSLLRNTRAGDYTLIVAIATATLFDGLLWELWNYYSMPKWEYTIPYVGFWKVFEMPILGYLGYPFFGLIVFSFTVLALSLLNESDAEKLTADENAASPIATEPLQSPRD